MVIGRRGARPITLGDVAKVVDTVEEQRSLALINGEPAVAIDITKQTKANTVPVVDAVSQAVDELRELPAGHGDPDCARQLGRSSAMPWPTCRRRCMLGGMLTDRSSSSASSTRGARR